MNLKTMFTISFVVYLLGGLGFMLIPEAAIAQYEITDPDNITILFSREFAGASLGFAVMSWMARSAGPSRARDGIVAGIVVTTVLLGTVDAIAILGGVLPAASWGAVAISALLAIGFAVTGRAAMASGN